jgi:DNA (cytosine-5)-methyltransferase 1
VKVLYGLDLFSGAGGATRGYLDAAASLGQVRLKMYGVDHRVQNSYLNSGGVEFIKADVFDILEDYNFVSRFDFIHSSPPCQIFSQLQHLPQNSSGKVDLLSPLRPYMQRYSRIPWIIENVERCSIMREDVMLCGSMFRHLHGYDKRRQLRRHRKFEVRGFEVPKLYCQHNGFRPLGVYGHSDDHIPGGASTASDLIEGRQLMGIEWMRWRDLVEAIPPAYTQYVGKYLLKELL